MLDLIFASFLITYYCTNTGLSGPFNMLDKFRQLMSVTEQTKSIVECPYCFSIYAALVVYGLTFITYGDDVVRVLAVTGAVCFMFKIVGIIDSVKDSADWISFVVEKETSSDEKDSS